MKKQPRWPVTPHMHKRWHIVPQYSGKRLIAYSVWRFNLLPEIALCAPQVAPDGLNREGRESLICGAYFDALTHKEGHGLKGTA